MLELPFVVIKTNIDLSVALGEGISGTTTPLAGENVVTRPSEYCACVHKRLLESESLLVNEKYYIDFASFLDKF